MVTRPAYLSLSWARWIQSMPCYPLSLRFILTVSSHLCLGLRHWPLSLRFSPPDKRQNYSPSPRFFNPFCNMLHFYGEALLVPHPPHKLEDHPLCKQPVVLFLIVTPTKHSLLLEAFIEFGNISCQFPPFCTRKPYHDVLFVNGSLLISFSVSCICCVHIVLFSLRLTNSLWNRVSHEKQIFSQWIHNCPHFMEPTGYYCIGMSLPVVPVLRQMNSVHAFPFGFIKFHPIIVLQNKPLSDKCALLFVFSDQNHVLVSLLFHAWHILRILND
jgi:hypothetical protein